MKFGELDGLFEMSNYLPNATGISYKIWVYEQSTSDQQLKHHLPRLKININGVEIPIVIDGYNVYPPKNVANKLPIHILNEVKEWVMLNYDILMLHWNNKIDTKEFVLRMKSIKD